MEIMLSHLGIGVAYDALDGLDIHAQRLHLRYIGVAAAVRCEQADIARFFQRFAEYIPEMGGIAGQAGLGAFPDELVGGIPQLDGTRADIQRHRNIPDEDYIASLFNIILLLVSRQQQESEKTTTSIPEEIEAAVAYFNENYNTKVSVDDYAESLHISTNWFIRNFKQYMKISPAQYILSLRMVNAQSLLENTEYNIGEIAEIVGYDNPLYFSRVFKKEYGVSPAQYRKNLEESTENEKNSL